MKKIQAYKHVPHKTDSNKPYFILQFLQIFAIFCNFSCNFEKFLVQYLQFSTI